MPNRLQSVAGNMPKVNNIFQISPNKGQEVKETSFKTELKQAIQEVDQLQKVADLQTERLVTGQPVDLHNVMITAQKATIALNATIEVRNKVVEAYQEISRMPL